MERQEERSLIKIYKDLMVTKRDLIDLRESITSTINSIRESDQRLKIIEMKKKMIKLIEGRPENEINHPALPPAAVGARGNQRICDLCSKRFSGLVELNQHRREDHKFCSHC